MGHSKPFGRMSVEERIRFDTEIVGKQCGWPDLDAALALLDDHPGWSIRYYRNGQAPFTDHTGRHEPGVWPGFWTAQPLGDDYEGTGSPRWVAATVADLAVMIESGPPTSCEPPN